MTALAIALGFLGLLAFAAFWLYLRSQVTNVDPSPVADLEARLLGIEEKISTIELQRGITRSVREIKP